MTPDLKSLEVFFIFKTSLFYICCVASNVNSSLDTASSARHKIAWQFPSIVVKRVVASSVHVTGITRPICLHSALLSLESRPVVSRVPNAVVVSRAVNINSFLEFRSHYVRIHISDS